MLTSSERQRYARHLLLGEFGEEGQERLQRGSALVVGLGGLGSPVALYLAAAGVGRIGLVEFDRVDLTNLQRQILYGTSDVGRPKIEAARERLHDLNPEIEIVSHPGSLTSGNALELFARYDVIVDATDNFPTRYLVNDACVLLGKPTVYGSIFRFGGQATVFDARRGPCYRCLYPQPPPPELSPSCAEAGVLGVLPGMIGSIQATETVKLLAGIGEPLIGRLLLFDALAMSMRRMEVRKNLECPICGERPTITQLIDDEGFCNRMTENDITPTQLAQELGPDGRQLVLVDVREPHEFSAGHLEGAVHIPLGQIPTRFAEIPPEGDIVVICRMGGRSAQAQQFLRRAGYGKVRNLVGGMTGWARDVDPTVRVV